MKTALFAILLVTLNVTAVWAQTTTRCTRSPDGQHMNCTTCCYNCC
jgi:hypothetical protein